MTKALVTSAIAAAALLSGSAAFAAGKPQPHPTATRMAPGKMAPGKMAPAKMTPAKASATRTTKAVKKTR